MLENIALKELSVILMAAVPIIELRGAIPYGIALGLSHKLVYIAAVIGSSLPAPIIILLFRKVLEFMREKGMFKALIRFLDNHIYKKSKKLKAANLIGLFLFVAIPLPTTGAYTGSILASMLNIRIKYALPAIVLGNMVAGLAMMGVSHIIF
ncbi:MAG: COG2426 family protein [Filifactoraceae bacterium]